MALIACSDTRLNENEENRKKAVYFFVDDYCFAGVEKNSYVAVGTIGCRKSEMLFMEGYKAMLQIIEPSKVICFGEPFDGMEGDIIYIDYRGSRKVVR